MTAPGPSSTPAQHGIAISLCLLAARIVAGGALLLAGVLKAQLFAGLADMQRAPLVLALGIESFRILPTWAINPTAHFLPWLEIIIGLTLLAGIWSRQSALLAAATLTLFTLALASVLLRGLDVDCGCFGGLFGESTVTLASILRNLVFIAAAIIVVARGPGRFALTRDDSPAPASTADKSSVAAQHPESA